MFSLPRVSLAAYGWSDLDLVHGFHATKQGERYTLSVSARRTVLDRLLAPSPVEINQKPLSRSCSEP